MPYCLKCGERVNEGDEFCNKCGARLEGEPGDIERAAVKTPETKDTAAQVVQAQIPMFDLGKAEVTRITSEESGFLVPWERQHCVPCIYNVDYREFEPSTSVARISPIATSYDICVLRWTLAREPCKYYCLRSPRGIQDIDLSRARSVVLELNNEVGLQHLRLLEQAKTPLNLLRLQEFLMSYGYQIRQDDVHNLCIKYYSNLPMRLHPRDYWLDYQRQAVCTVLALEFVSEHNGCQLSDIEIYSDSVNWAKKGGIKPKIQALRKQGFITTSQKPRFLGGFDPSTRVEITKRGNSVLDSLRETVRGLLRFTEEKKVCQMSGLKKYWQENCSDVVRTFALLGLSHDELNWHLPMVAPMVWKEYLEVDEESPYKARFNDENMVRLTAKGQQQCWRTGYLPLRSFYI